MTDKTSEQLIHRALTELGRLYVGDAPTDEDYNTVEELIQPLVDQVNAMDIAYIDDIEAIEQKWFLPLARLVAIEACGSFGNDAIQTLLTRNRAGNVDALREREYDALRRILAPGRAKRVLTFGRDLLPYRRRPYVGDS